MKNIILSIILFLVYNNIFSQTKIIKGRVIAEDLCPVPYCSIIINDSIIGQTDLNGFFQVEIPIDIKRITFSEVGFELSVVEMDKNCTTIEVILIFAGTYDFISIKKSNRLIRKKFKRIIKIHKKAFEKGLFKTKQPCFNYDLSAYGKDKKLRH